MNLLTGLVILLLLSSIVTFAINPAPQVGASLLTSTSSLTTTLLPPPSNLTATVVSSSQISLTWTAPAGGSLIVSGYQIERSTDGGATWSTIQSNTGSTSTTYPDTGLSPITSYTYRVSAIEAVGTSPPSNTASATTPSITSTAPQPPTSLTAIAASISQINLSWTAPANNGGSAITGYEIERSTDGGTTWSSIQSNTGNSTTTYSDTGLASNTTYTYRVSAINSAGTSSPSNTASATTPSVTGPSPIPGNVLPSTPSSITTQPNPVLPSQIIPIPPTTNYSINQTSSGLIVSDSLTNETLTQQQLQSSPGYWRYGGDAPAENAPYAISRDTQGLHVGVQAPTNGTWAGYYAVTQKTNAILFHSVITTPVSTISSNSNWYENGMYVQNATGNVNYVTCTSITSASGTQWIVSAANGNPFGATTFTPLWWSAMTPTQPLTRDCTIITNGTNYLKVYLDGTPVYSSNTLKLNMSSNLIAFMEPQTNYAGQLLSGTFKNFYATANQYVKVTNNPVLASKVYLVEPTSSTTGKVVATAPVDSSGNAVLDIGNYTMPVNAYIIVYDSNGNTMASTSNPVNLFGGDVYSVSGTPISYSVNSTTNTVFSLTNSPTPNVLPSPTGLTATTVSSSQISLTWTAPAGGSLIVSGYQIERSTDGGATWSTIQSNFDPSSTIYLDNGLAPGTAYAYRVSAIYPVGTSPPSNNASATTQSTTYQLTVSSQLTTGRSLPGMYTQLQNSTGQVVASGFTPVTFVLKNGVQYSLGIGSFATFSFDYWNDTGSATNPRSISISSNTPITAIYQDTALQLSPTSGSANTTVSVIGTTFSANQPITMTWDGTALATNPATITSNSTGGFTATFQVPSTASSGSHTVQATDGTNTHAALFTVGHSATATAPQQPTDLTATAVTSSQINLFWTAPSNNGGSAITGYKIERSTNMGITWSTIQPNTGSTSTTYPDTGLSPITSYTYRVSAINSVGTSSPSNTASATTPATIGSINLLPPPTALTATTVSSSQISLTWTAPAGGSLIVSGYQIERSTDGGTTWFTIQSNTGSTSTIYLDDGLSPSTTYTYRASAIYAGLGTSPPSNTASATTQSTTYQLTVSSQLTTGGSLTGMYTELRNSTGQIVATGFTPVTFVLLNGAQYTVGMGGFATYSFDYWNDTNSATNPRSISISSNTQITAIYQDAALQLSPPRGPAGTTVSVIGTTFSANQPITMTWDGTALATNPATITSNSTGGFTATFQVPSTASSGSHTVQATDGTNTHAALFTVGPSAAITLTNTSTNVGTGVRVTGTNFASNSQIIIYFDDTAIGVGEQNIDSGNTVPLNVVTDSNGNFNAIISILRSVEGIHTITVQDSSNTQASESITVAPHVFIFPTSGHAGSTVQIPASQGNGFAANSAISIKFDGTTITPTTAMTTDTEGNFGGSFMVPSSAALGPHQITVSDAKGNSYTNSFNVTASNTPTYSVSSIITGLSLPDSFAFIPDNGPSVDGSGSFMVTEKDTGNVIVFKNVNGVFTRQSVPFVMIPNLQTNTEDNGLLGIAFDPNWITSKMVYFYVTRNATVNGSPTDNVIGEVIRYHATTDSAGNIVADSSVGEKLILDNIPAWQDGHNGGHLKFDSSGNLYVTTGDGWTFTAGQNLTTLQAKILRITPLASPVNGKMYSIPSTNPFASSTNTSIKKEIWAYGVRNPDTFDIDTTGKIYVAEPGFNTWERINNMTLGGSNAGWPNYESPPYGNPQNLTNYTPQIYWYPHEGVEPQTGPTAGLEAITGAAFYHGTNYPNLQGAYFFGDYGVGFIAALLPSSMASPTKDLASGEPKSQVIPIYYGLAYAPIGMQVWNGKIYFLDITGSVDVLNYS